QTNKLPSLLPPERSGPANASSEDECDVIAAQIAQVTGARVDSANSGNGTIALTHPAASEIDFGCYPNRKRFLSFYSDNGWPTDVWWELVERGGARFTGFSEKTLRGHTENCLRGAIQKGNFDIETDTVIFYCTGGPKFGNHSHVDIEPK